MRRNEQGDGNATTISTVSTVMDELTKITTFIQCPPELQLSHIVVSSSQLPNLGVII